MNPKFRQNIIKLLFISVLILNNSIISAQNENSINSKSSFWQNVKYGGGLGLTIGNGFTDIAVSPTLYYPLNETIIVGAGLNASYSKSRNEFTTWTYGPSLVTLVNPIENLQISAELEQLRVATKFQYVNGFQKDNFWNTSLFLGAGFRMNNATLGLRYNILHQNNNFIYTDPLMPFVRVIF